MMAPHEHCRDWQQLLDQPASVQRAVHVGRESADDPDSSWPEGPQVSREALAILEAQVDQADVMLVQLERGAHALEPEWLDQENAREAEPGALRGLNQGDPHPRRLLPWRLPA